VRRCRFRDPRTDGAQDGVEGRPVKDLIFLALVGVDLLPDRAFLRGAVGQREARRRGDRRGRQREALNSAEEQRRVMFGA